MSDCANPNKFLVHKLHGFDDNLFFDEELEKEMLFTLDFVKNMDEGFKELEILDKQGPKKMEKYVMHNKVLHDKFQELYHRI